MFGSSTVLWHSKLVPFCVTTSCNTSNSCATERVPFQQSFVPNWSFIRGTWHEHHLIHSALHGSCIQEAPGVSAIFHVSLHRGQGFDFHPTKPILKSKLSIVCNFAYFSQLQAPLICKVMIQSVKKFRKTVHVWHFRIRLQRESLCNHEYETSFVIMYAFRYYIGNPHIITHDRVQK